ncbi:hydroxyacid dehydrogenase [Vreelandella malpeensis]|uniref:Hydroxyacid dehydrogenase n=1 Tax=Vreelandella malpeensis TaxID=1172368 RepID=A0ABS8DNP7_9GAMM|nr:hydroxyacid dehydrogenase [Halomonas malpeensis]MCB8887927.1 hydroxyacid dehydrogenase [Halomonas malpeensis]
MSPTILVTAPRLANEGRRVLEDAGCQVLFVPKGEEDRLQQVLASRPIDAIIARTLTLDRDAIAACPGLRAISRHGVGHDAVDLDAAAERGIPVSVVGETNAQSVAELAIGLMIACARRLPDAHERIRLGEWPRQTPGVQLAGRTLGLVGCGTIATHVARIATALGMRVVGYDPGRSALPAPIEKIASLETLLGMSDVLSLHCPLLPATRHVIDATALATLPAGAFVINTARGGLIDEQALAQAITSGHIAGAGLDTLEMEPPRFDHPLLNMAGVVLTPHVGGNSDAALAATARAAAENALAMLAGKPPTHGRIVNAHLLESTS